jgi:hypothetical protein
MPSTLLPRRWALTPPFHPYPHRVPFEDVPKVFLRAITGLRAAGGIFSVALSVNSSTGFSLCFFFARTFPTRVPPKLHRLMSVLPPPWRYQAHCPSPSGLTAQGYSLLAQSGVRTFLPPGPLARSGPAIVQLTRHSHYIARSAALIAIVPRAERRLLHSKQLLEFAFRQHRHSQFFRLVVLRSRVCAHYHIVRLLAH